MAKEKPDAVVHCAALVGINACEKDKKFAYKINVEGAKNIAESAHKINSRVIYISTDYVFDGSKGMYSEVDKPSPINYYGESKLEGEQFMNLQRDAIIRTSIFGWNIVPQKKSFSSWIIEELENKKNINVFDDQFNSMILVNNLSQALSEIVEQGHNGILNVASSERISKHEFALKLAKIFNLDSSLINPIKNLGMAGFEKRPHDTSLDISKAKKILKTKLNNMEENIKMLKKLKEENYLNNFR